MQAKELAQFKDRLLKLRTRFANQVNSAEESLREDVRSPGELSNIPTHPADHAAEGIDEQIAIAQNEERLFSDVEGALERIEAGTYGKCVDCGKPIGRERLEAIPYTPWCLECAKKHSSELLATPATR
jgi:DnaK suppressor protein